MKEHIIINNDRTVTVPASVTKIGNRFEHNVNKVTFDCPRYADDEQTIDLSAMKIYINYIRPDKKPLSSLAENVTVDEADPTIMHFDFNITRTVTLVDGVLDCLVCIKSTNSEGVEEHHWNSDIFSKLTVGKGMENEETIAEENIDLITQLLVNLDTTNAEVSDVSERLIGVYGKVGELETLATEDKSSVVAAVNEVKESSDNVVESVDELKSDIADIEQVVMAGYSFNLITDTFLLKDINTWSDVSSLNLSNYTYDSANFNVYQIHVVGGKSYYFFNANSTTNKLEYLQVPNLIVFDASGNASERKSGQYSFGAIEDGYIAISANKALKVVIADHDVHGEDYIEHKKLPKEFAEKKDINNIEEKLTGIDRRVSLLESNEAETVIPNVVKSKLLAKSINTWSDISSLKTDNYTYDNEDFNNYFAEVTETGRYWFYRNNNGEASDVTFPNIITFDADGNALERFSSKAYVDVTENVAFVSFDYNKNYDCMLVKGGYTGNFYGIGEPLRENTRHYDTFSILGDSYSTFDGYLKDERAGAWYPADSTKPNNDVTKVDETWWYQFANNYGCTLIANNSWTGTTIGYDSYSEGLDDGKESSFLKRYNNLDRPELIFIFGGTNDEWASNDTGRSDFLGDYKYSDFSESDFVYFRPSLAKLIDSVQHNNIGAKIVFVLNSGLVKINDSVETICNHYGIDLIKLNNIAKGNSHPTIEGMKTIAYEIEWFLRQRK